MSVHTQTVPFIQPADSKIRFVNKWDHFLIRMRYKRNKHQVKPGLFKLGNPDAQSPVFVSANYTLSFDALRAGLKGIDCFILVLNTHGINVWCAAGKGTFGTKELLDRIETVSLHNVVNHRKLILPQLGAPGVAAHQVKQKSGFNVEFGPVRAEDLPEYLKTYKATKEMRRVNFNLADRLILIPVELVAVFIPILIAAVLAYFIGGLITSAAVITSILVGVVLFPVLLPWIPTPNFSTKGLFLGFIFALPFVLLSLFSSPNTALLERSGWALVYLLSLPPVTTFIALNFTGATTFTSRSGVKREIYKYIPVMAWMFGSGIILSAALFLVHVLGS